MMNECITFGTQDLLSLSKVDVWEVRNSTIQTICKGAAAALVHGPPTTHHLGATAVVWLHLSKKTNCQWLLWRRIDCHLWSLLFIIINRTDCLPEKHTQIIRNDMKSI